MWYSFIAFAVFLVWWQVESHKVRYPSATMEARPFIATLRSVTIIMGLVLLIKGV